MTKHSWSDHDGRGGVANCPICNPPSRPPSNNPPASPGEGAVAAWRKKFRVVTRVSASDSNWHYYDGSEKPPFSHPDEIACEPVYTHPAPQPSANPPVAWVDPRDFAQCEKVLASKHPTRTATMPLYGYALAIGIDVPKHDCEFLTDPERGRCEGHELFAAGYEAGAGTPAATERDSSKPTPSSGAAPQPALAETNAEIVKRQLQNWPMFREAMRDAERFRYLLRQAVYVGFNANPWLIDPSAIDHAIANENVPAQQQKEPPNV